MAWASKRIVVPGCIAFAIWWVLAVFPNVRILPIGRTAGSLVGAVLMVVSQVISPTSAFAAVDLSILGLLFGTMVISIYLERADLFKYLGHALEWRTRGGKDLLCRVCLLAAISSALFTNDTTCVLLTGFVLKICREKKLSPHPFLMALATSSNIGSSATSIGNPQNLVIAVQGNIGFGTFLKGILSAMLVGMIVNTVSLLVFYWRVLESRVPEPSNTVANSEIGVDSTLPQAVTRNGLTGSPRQLPGSARRSNELEDMEHGCSLHIELPNQGPVEPQTESDLPTQSPRSDIRDPNRGEAYISGSSPSLPDNMTTSNSAPAREGVIRIPFTHRLIQRRSIWKVCVYLVALGMLAALLGGLNLAWTAITAAIVLIVLDFRDASPSLDKVSYALLVFFSGMFITVEGFNLTGAPEVLWTAVEPHAQINTTSGLAVLSLLVTLLSNVASNVPTVLLLGPRLAISSAATPGVSVTKAWLVLAWARFRRRSCRKLLAMACTGGGLLQRCLPRAPPAHCTTSQSSLIAPTTTTALLRSLAPPRSSLLPNQSVRLQTLTARGAVRRGSLSVQCSAAGAGGGVGDSGESPYQTLGVSPLEKFDNIKNVYGRRKKDAESRGDAAAVESLDRAYDRIMMMQLSNRKQGLAFGGQFEVSKEIKYADKRSWIPWGPKSAPSERKEVLINLAISGFFSAWMVASAQAEWKPLQFLIFGYMFRIFNKLKEFEPAGSTYVPTEDEEEGGGAERDSSRRLKSGKRLLRTLGLVFSCVACASLAFTGTLNVYELLGQYIPRTLMGAQELFVTVVSAVLLFVMGSFFR